MLKETVGDSPKAQTVGAQANDKTQRTALPRIPASNRSDVDGIKAKDRQMEVSLWVLEGTPEKKAHAIDTFRVRCSPEEGIPVNPAACPSPSEAATKQSQMSQQPVLDEVMAPLVSGCSAVFDAELLPKQESNNEFKKVDTFAQYGFLFIAHAAVVIIAFAFDRHYGSAARHMIDECGASLEAMRVLDSADIKARELCATEASQFGKVSYFEDVILLLWIKFVANMSWSYSIAYRFLRNHPVTFIFFVLNGILVGGIFLSTRSDSKDRTAALPLLMMGTEAVCVALVVCEANTVGVWYHQPGLRLQFYVVLLVDLLVGAAVAYLSYVLGQQPSEYVEQRGKAKQLVLTMNGIATLLQFIYLWCCWWAEDLRWEGRCGRKLERMVFHLFVYLAVVGAMVNDDMMYQIVLVGGGPVACFRVFASVRDATDDVEGGRHMETHNRVAHPSPYDRE